MFWSFYYWLISSVISVIEIKCDRDFTNFRRNPISHVRIGSINRNPEIEKLVAMGVTFQWLDKSSSEGSDRKWKEARIQRFLLFNNIKDGSGDLDQIKSAMNIFAMLTQINYIGPQKPEWIRPVKFGVIRNLKLDHLKQKTTLEVMQSADKIWPPDHTIPHNAQRLRDAVRNNQYPTAIGKRPKMAEGRTACDFCISLTTVGLDFMIPLCHHG